MRNPLAVLGPRRRAAAVARVHPAPGTTWSQSGDQDGPEAHGGEGGALSPEVSVRGIDPRTDRPSAVAAVHLTARPGAPAARSVEELLAGVRPGHFLLRRLVFDVRGLDAVLDARGNRPLLDQLVAHPGDRVTNAVFRAAVADDAAGDDALPGDLDCEVRVVGDGDSVAGRCRLGLGRGRLAIMPVIIASERVARRLAEARARPCDRAVRRCLEHALSTELSTTPLPELLAVAPGPPSCRVPDTGR